MIPRDIREEFESLLAEYPVVAVLGPRQAGKTTLAKSLSGYDYISLETPETRELAMEDPRALFKQHPNQLIIDEIQRVPDLLSHIQQIVDEERVEGRFVLTGSHQLLLRESMTQSLAGRVGILTLLPFSIRELRSASISFNRFTDYAHTGFLPRVYDRNLRPTIAYENYYQTYVERDVRQMINLKNAVAFEKFLKLLAGRTGQLMNAASLGTDTGVDSKTVTHWLSILEASYIILRLPPYHMNFGKRMIRSPKYYFTEPGLLTYLLGIESPDQVQRDPLVGGIFENIVVVEMVKTLANRGRRPTLYFLRDSNGNEVDILVNHSGVLTGVEIKSAATFHSGFFDSFERMARKGIPVQRRIVVYSGDNLEFSDGRLAINYQDIGDFFMNSL